MTELAIFLLDCILIPMVWVRDTCQRIERRLQERLDKELAALEDEDKP